MYKRQADAPTLAALQDEAEFIAAVAQLLSEDARLLQQGYGPLETRFFYRDFFDVLVQRGAFDLLQSLDLLVPHAITGELSLALSSRPLSALSPTRFEQDQEALALLIRAGEPAAVIGVWGDLGSAQRRDAVLFALDQGVLSAAEALYSLLEPEDFEVDFLLRVALYSLYIGPNWGLDEEVPLDAPLGRVGEGS